jgi:hypothetical protein
MRYITYVILALTSFAYAGVDGIIYKDAIWENKTVTVCYADSEYLTQNNQLNKELRFNRFPIKLVKDPSLKNIQRIKNIVTSEYQASKTGIAFVGFKHCKDTETPQLVLLNIKDNDDFLGKASIGGKYPNKKSATWKGITRLDIGRVLSEKNFHKKLSYIPYGISYVSITDYDEMKAGLKKVAGENFSYMNFDNYFRFVTLHEFGHSAGLMHEQYHAKGPNTLTCPDANFKMKEHSGFEITKNYDPASIMNYCFSRQNRDFLKALVFLQTNKKINQKEKNKELLDLVKLSPDFFLLSQFYTNWDKFPEFSKLLKMRNFPISLSKGDKALLKKHYTR